MSKPRPKSMSDVFRKAIADSGFSLYRIGKDSGVSPQSLLRFERGDQSLRLDKADLLAKYLGLRIVRDPHARPPKPTPENLARPMLARRKPRRKGK